MKQLYKAKTTINFILYIKDDPVTNNYCQKEYNIKHFRVLVYMKYQGIKIRRELKSSWNKIKLKTFEQQGLDIDKKLM
jgi:hypothetical protein